MKRLKNKIKQILYLCSGILSLKMLLKLANRELLVINYHSIMGVDPDPIINKNIYRTEEQFEQDILFLKRYYNFVTLNQVLNFVLKNEKLPANSVFLTFDDGLKVVFDKIRPILLKHKVSAAFFLNPAFIDNKDLHYQRKKNLILQRVSKEQLQINADKWKELLDETDIKTDDFCTSISSVNYKKSDVFNQLGELFEIDFGEYAKQNQIYLTKRNIEIMINEGFAFGGHSIDHPKYEELTKEEQIEQTIESINWVREQFNLDYSVFAFPLRDHQISKSLFKAIQLTCDLSFGVRGIGDDVIANHIQRIDAENTGVDINLVLKFEYTKYLVRKVLGRGYFNRPI